MIVLKMDDLKKLNGPGRSRLHLNAMEVAIGLGKLFQTAGRDTSEVGGMVAVIEDMNDYSTLKSYQLDIETQQPEWVRRITTDVGDDPIISLFLLRDGSALVLLTKMSMIHPCLLIRLN